MSSIRKLEEKDINVLSRRIWTNVNWSEGVGQEQIDDRKDFANAIINYIEHMTLYGFYKENELLGAMILTDYTMNLHSTKTLVGGLRGISVDLMHKKEKLAMSLVSFACSHYKERGSCILALYPFRTDFYKKMGFGYGTILKEYKVRPEYIPNYKSKDHLEYYDNENQKEAILDCYQRFADNNHGMFDKSGDYAFNLFSDEKRIISYKKNEKIEGYINFSFKTVEHYKSYLIVNEFIYETKEAFSELCTFLHTQADQCEYIIIQSQDEYLHYNFSNPATGTRSPFNSQYIDFSVSSVGMMYRIIDVKRYFEVLKLKNFNNQTCKLKISISDSFFKPNNGSTIVSFIDGHVEIGIEEDYEVEIFLDISDFSSIAVGSVSFKTLLRYGLVSISDIKFADTVERIFNTREKPICNTFF